MQEVTDEPYLALDRIDRIKITRKLQWGNWTLKFYEIYRGGGGGNWTFGVVKSQGSNPYK